MPLLEVEVLKLKKGTVGIGTITDAYQPAEAKYKITRRSLELLLEKGFKVSIQTKNPLVLRDLDILKRFRENVDLGFTITTMRGKVSSFLEPCAPHPLKRADALRMASYEGLKTWIFYGPIIPGINDTAEDVKSLVNLAEETGSILYYDPLRIKPFMLFKDHPLYKIALEGRVKFLLSNTIHLLKKKCEEQGVECKGGFEVV